MTQHGLSREALIAGISAHASSSNGGNYAGGSDSTDAVVERVCEIEITVGIHRHGFGQVEQRGRCRSAIAAIMGRAGDGRDVKGLIQFPDSLVILIGNIQEAIRVESDPGWIEQLRRRTGASITRKAGGRYSAGRHSGDGPDIRAGDHSNQIEIGVGNVEIARIIHDQTVAYSNCGIHGRSVSQCAAVPGDYVDQATGCKYLEDKEILGDINVARTVNRDRIRKGELRRRRRAI
jgi:hypothetical protein